MIIEQRPITVSISNIRPAQMTIGYPEVIRKLEEWEKSGKKDEAFYLGYLEIESLWIFMDNRNWRHPYDENERRCAFADIPDHISKLMDDPFRSLARELRRPGCFGKSEILFFYRQIICDQKFRNMN